jgi:8-oxo-dGTP diphosphatase
MPLPKTPPVTVDIVIRTRGNTSTRPGLVLVYRKNTPVGWALPGGFVDLGESVETAAKREALEETGLRVGGLRLLGVYSDPKRDPRGPCVSIAFAAEASGVPKAGDDAGKVKVFQLRDLPKLVFDHAEIVKDYVRLYGEG